MLRAAFLSVVIPVCVSLRVGFLSDDSEDKAVLNDCIRNTSIDFVTLLACHNYNGLENVARLHYDYQVNVLLGSPCNEESETVSRLAYRWGIPFLSTSMLSSQDREATTLAMVPDYQLGLARAIVTLLSEIEAKRVTVLHTNEFHTAATALSMEMDEHTKLIEFSEERFDLHHDIMGGVILFLVSNERREEALKEVIFSFRRVLVNTKFVVYDDGRVDAALFFMDLQVILNELKSEIQKQIILANFVLAMSSDSNSTVLLSLRLVIGDCEDGECGTRYTLLAALVVFGVVGVPLVVAFQFQRREREIHRMPWRIAYESVLRAKKEATPLPGYRKISSTSSSGLSGFAGFNPTYEPESSPAYLNDQKVISYFPENSIG
ncbi:hypothetical protein ANCDUO_23496 [Ancylostoma duodenale]|uniref:Receptor ligand binding region domain-containing protein n=1 Tax=Ancylostoma duodenale TaxID=51022 RepID=A0A0C2C9H9_9BILA|nr:hypothetical protein ANCDUO_23496 [Ancylostoma duodenale]